MDKTTLYALLGVAVVAGVVLAKKERAQLPQTDGGDSTKPKAPSRITTRVVPSR